MYLDVFGEKVPPVDQQYTAPDGTTYPRGFPREDIPNLTWAEDPSPPPPEKPSFEAVKANIMQRVHERLNTFAQSRGYDSILSACTYATDDNLRFQADGKYCVAARSATWGFLFTLLGEIEAGIKESPENYTDIEPLLPPLEWPEL